MTFASATANAAFTSPAPATSGESEREEDAESWTMVLICIGVREGFACNISAMTPATLGAAADVPKKSLRPLGIVVLISSVPETATGLRLSGPFAIAVP